VIVGMGERVVPEDGVVGLLGPETLSAIVAPFCGRPLLDSVDWHASLTSAMRPGVQSMHR
jgi:hypothetical protein